MVELGPPDRLGESIRDGPEPRINWSRFVVAERFEKEYGARRIQVDQSPVHLGQATTSHIRGGG